MFPAPPSLAAYDLWLRGMDCLKQATLEGDEEARSLFRQALYHPSPTPHLLPDLSTVPSPKILTTITTVPLITFFE